MKVTSATQQHQMLHGLWPKWRNIAASINGTHRAKAEDAVKRLYAFYRRSEPTIHWLDSMHRLPEDWIGAPFLAHVRETLIYAAWHQLAEPGWVCAQIGYNQHDGVFRLPSNWRVITTRATVAPRRTGRRMPWLRAGTNVVSQFDADALAIVELATECGVPLDKSVLQLADIVADLVRACFATYLFEDRCLLVLKPARLLLNEAQLLSAQAQPAFVSAGDSYALYITNERVISVNRAPYINFDLLHHWSSPRLRVALIEYMGWDAFFALMSRHHHTACLGRDRFGSLHVIRCGSQEFLVVHVTNKTPEPDGHFRQYYIPVDRFCRPLPNPNDPRQRFGEPQSPTPLNAVASTFGMTGPQYAAILGKES